jgi:hypothetical protein
MDDKSVEVTYTFFLPEHKDELDTFLNASNCQTALYDIWHECRSLLKYHDNVSDELTLFAEKIKDLSGEFLDW